MSIVTSMTTGVSEREANDALNAYVSTMSLIRSAWGSSELQTGRRKDGGQDLRD